MESFYSTALLHASTPVREIILPSLLLRLCDHTQPQDRSSGKRKVLGQFGKQCFTERDVFEVLGLDYVEPTRRGV